MAKRGRPAIDKVPLSTKRLQEALDYVGVSLRCLDTDPIVAASEKTIRRAKKEGIISPAILERLGKRLNVDPLFLQGKMDDIARKMSVDEKTAEELMSQFVVSDFPYLNQEKRELDSKRFISELLIENDISPEQLHNLLREQQILFYLELDKAISKVVHKYFTPFRASIHNYSIPMPPEDEIIHI